MASFNPSSAIKVVKLQRQGGSTFMSEKVQYIAVQRRVSGETSLKQTTVEGVYEGGFDSTDTKNSSDDVSSGTGTGPDTGLDMEVEEIENETNDDTLDDEVEDEPGPQFTPLSRRTDTATEPQSDRQPRKKGNFTAMVNTQVAGISQRNPGISLLQPLPLSDDGDKLPEASRQERITSVVQIPESVSKKKSQVDEASERISGQLKPILPKSPLPVPGGTIRLTARPQSVQPVQVAAQSSVGLKQGSPIKKATAKKHTVGGCCPCKNKSKCILCPCASRGSACDLSCRSPLCQFKPADPETNPVTTILHAPPGSIDSFQRSSLKVGSPRSILNTGSLRSSLNVSPQGSSLNVSSDSSLDNVPTSAGITHINVVQQPQVAAKETNNQHQPAKQISKPQPSQPPVNTQPASKPSTVVVNPNAMHIEIIVVPDKENTSTVVTDESFEDYLLTDAYSPNAGGKSPAKTGQQVKSSAEKRAFNKSKKSPSGSSKQEPIVGKRNEQPKTVKAKKPSLSPKHGEHSCAGVEWPDVIPAEKLHVVVEDSAGLKSQEKLKVQKAKKQSKPASKKILTPVKLISPRVSISPIRTTERNEKEMSPLSDELEEVITVISGDVASPATIRQHELLAKSGAFDDKLSASKKGAPKKSSKPKLASKLQPDKKENKTKKNQRRSKSPNVNGNGSASGPKNTSFPPGIFNNPDPPCVRKTVVVRRPKPQAIIELPLPPRSATKRNSRGGRRSVSPRDGNTGTRKSENKRASTGRLLAWPSSGAASSTDESDDEEEVEPLRSSRGRIRTPNPKYVSKPTRRHSKRLSKDANSFPVSSPKTTKPRTPEAAETIKLLPEGGLVSDVSVYLTRTQTKVSTAREAIKKAVKRLQKTPSRKTSRNANGLGTSENFRPIGSIRMEGRCRIRSRKSSDSTLDPSVVQDRGLQLSPRNINQIEKEKSWQPKVSVLKSPIKDLLMSPTSNGSTKSGVATKRHGPGGTPSNPSPPRKKFRSELRASLSRLCSSSKLKSPEITSPRTRSSGVITISSRSPSPRRRSAFGVLTSLRTGFRSPVRRSPVKRRLRSSSPSKRESRSESAPRSRVVPRSRDGKFRSVSRSEAVRKLRGRSPSRETRSSSSLRGDGSPRLRVNTPSREGRSKTDSGSDASPRRVKSPSKDNISRSTSRSDAMKSLRFKSPPYRDRSSRSDSGSRSSKSGGDVFRKRTLSKSDLERLIPVKPKESPLLTLMREARASGSESDKSPAKPSIIKPSKLSGTNRKAVSSKANRDGKITSPQTRNMKSPEARKEPEKTKSSKKVKSPFHVKSPERVRRMLTKISPSPKKKSEVSGKQPFSLSSVLRSKTGSNARAATRNRALLLLKRAAANSIETASRNKSNEKSKRKRPSPVARKPVQVKPKEHKPKSALNLGFKVGLRLEAIDKNNPDYVCVASVASIKGEFLRVHFDGWVKGYDFWCRPDSPYIHPVGWCQENDVALSPPQDWPDIDAFTWEEYLAQKKAKPVPETAFLHPSNIMHYQLPVFVPDTPEDTEVSEEEEQKVEPVRQTEIKCPKHYDPVVEIDRLPEHILYCVPFDVTLNPVEITKIGSGKGKRAQKTPTLDPAAVAEPYSFMDYGSSNLLGTKIIGEVRASPIPYRGEDKTSVASQDGKSKKKRIKKRRISGTSQLSHSDEEMLSESLEHQMSFEDENSRESNTSKKSSDKISASKVFGGSEPMVVVTEKSAADSTSGEVVENVSGNKTTDNTEENIQNKNDTSPSKNSDVGSGGVSSKTTDIVSSSCSDLNVSPSRTKGQRRGSTDQVDTTSLNESSENLQSRGSEKGEKQNDGTEQKASTSYGGVLNDSSDSVDVDKILLLPEVPGLNLSHIFGSPAPKKPKLYCVDLVKQHSSGSGYCCVLCDNGNASDSIDALRHITDDHTFCPVCVQSFKEVHLFMDHADQHTAHPDVNESTKKMLERAVTSRDVSLKPRELVKETQTTIACRLCDGTFPDKDSAEEHAANFHLKAKDGTQSFQPNCVPLRPGTHHVKFLDKTLGMGGFIGANNYFAGL